MVASARAGIHGADVVCWLLAADRGLTPVDRAEAENLAQARTVAVINKIDTVARDALLPIMAAVGELLPESDCLPLSARSGEGVEALVDLLCDAAPKGPWLFEGDQITDQNERLLFAELVREQLFRQMSQELPYRVAVVVDEFSRVGGEIRLAASVFTDSDGSKKMIVGKGGRRIKSIGIAARRAAAELAGTTVHLSLQVRVKKNWQRDTAFLRELGL
jgi:GTP-binding protein Era